MPRSLLVWLLAATALAAPVPKKEVKDYQKLADETEWQFTEFSFDTAAATELKGYSVKGVFDARDGVVTVSNEKGEKLHSWDTHRNAPFVHRDGTLYYAEFSPISTGCHLVAFDLKTKKQQWKTLLKGMGNVMHSKYRNEVRLEVLDDQSLRVFGKESQGRYVEIVNRETGKTVGHKVFDEKK